MTHMTHKPKRSKGPRDGATRDQKMMTHMTHMTHKHQAKKY